MLKKAMVLTGQPRVYFTFPPEYARTDSLPWDAPYPVQGRSERRGKVSNVRTPLAEFFSILLQSFVGGNGGGKCQHQILWLLEVVIIEQHRMCLQVGGVEISCHKVRLLHDFHHKGNRRLHAA
jgi:hypothetical protein